MEQASSTTTSTATATTTTTTTASQAALESTRLLWPPYEAATAPFLSLTRPPAVLVMEDDDPYRTTTTSSTTTTISTLVDDHGHSAVRSSTTTASFSWPFLFERLAGDVGIALTVTGLVTPALTVIDQALVQRSAAGGHLGTHITAAFQQVWQRPGLYFRSPTFCWMWLTYASTYATANVLKTLTTEQHSSSASTTGTPAVRRPTLPPPSHHEYYYRVPHTAPVPLTLVGNSSSSSSFSSSLHTHPYINHHPPTTTTTTTTTSSSFNSSSSWWSTAAVFVGTAVVNSTASILKDRAYARMFATGTTPRAVPTVSYALWMARDATVIGSSFILPDWLAQQLITPDHHQQQQHSPSASTNRTIIHVTEARATAVAQILSPLLAQVVAGPLHYTGLLWYSQPASTPWPERWRALSTALPSVVALRMVRILPGYGLAGVWNRQGRAAWRDFLIQRHVQRLLSLQSSTTPAAASVATTAEVQPRISQLVQLIRAKKE